MRGIVVPKSLAWEMKNWQKQRGIPKKQTAKYYQWLLLAINIKMTFGKWLKRIKLQNGVLQCFARGWGCYKKVLLKNVLPLQFSFNSLWQGFLRVRALSVKFLNGLRKYQIKLFTNEYVHDLKAKDIALKCSWDEYNHRNIHCILKDNLNILSRQTIYPCSDL